MSSQIPKSHISLKGDISVCKWMVTFSSLKIQRDLQQFYSVLTRKYAGSLESSEAEFSGFTAHLSDICCAFFLSQWATASW